MSMSLAQAPTSARLAVKRMTDLAEVRALVPAWRDLLADSATNELTHSPEWLLTWWDVFGGLQGRQLRVVAFHENDRLIGLAPLLLRRHWYRPGLPFRRLEPLGTGERERDSICSDYLTILARSGREAEIARAFVQTLTTGALGGWDELVMPLMDDSQPMPGLLASLGQQAGLRTERKPTTTAPYIPLPTSWEAYLQALGKKERYLIKRSMRDIEEWAGNDWRVERATFANLNEGKRILHELHHERWQKTGAGVFRSALFLDFHDRMMALLLERNALELLWLIARGQPVAAMYNITWSGKNHFYQCGRSLSVPASIRPGGVLLYLAIRRAIEANLREFDFLGGDAIYKKQLALASRPLAQLRLARKSLVERGREATEWGKELVRPLWRRLHGKRDSPAPIETDT
jgi:CelD/BcsL family acetyltransferase involved in cellulose biosynthesis